MRHRWSSLLLWALALVVTLGLGLFQRMTGPSWPARGQASLSGEAFRYRLPRSHGGEGDLEVRVPAPQGASGRLLWRRYPTGERYHELSMVPDGGRLTASVPHQPVAGKVEYRVVLEAGGEEVSLPQSGTAVARFRGSVPAPVLIPHILAMFVGMLLATRALLESFTAGGGAPKRHVLGAMLLLAVGGLLMGPLVQWYAFGAWWTGWPVGSDLTDTKTLVAVLAWLPATVACLRRRPARLAVAVGWVVMMSVFLVPHSLYGSQLDWADVPGGGTASSAPAADGG